MQHNLKDSLLFETFAVLEYWATDVGSWLRTFRTIYRSQFQGSDQSKTLEDGPAMFSRNVGNQPTAYAAKHPTY
jgi:hypothetical protein